MGEDFDSPSSSVLEWSNSILGSNIGRRGKKPGCFGDIFYNLV